MSEDPHRMLEEIIKTETAMIEELDSLFHLLEEMTQVTDSFMVWSLEYCHKHKIPIENETQFTSYIKTSKILLRETGERMSDMRYFLNNPKSSADERKQRFGTDGEVTEPLIRFCQVFDCLFSL